MSSQIITDLYELGLECSTENGITDVSLNWYIPNFKNITKSHCDAEVRTNRTTDFIKDIDENCKFQLRMRFLGNGQMKQLYFLAPRTLFLKMRVDFDFSSEINLDYKWVQANTWQLLAERHFELKYGDIFKAYFTITINLKSSNEKVEYIDMPEAKLTHDLSNHFNNPALSDVTIKSTEGIEFHSHKLLLSIRSDVLRAHFDHDTVEKLTNIVESPFESKVLEAVLMYIYTDNVANINEMPEILLKAADFYQLNGLKYFCEKALRENLTVDNVIETMQLASTYRCENLRKYCINFIIDGNAELLIETNSWKEFLSIDLLKTIAECIIKKNKYLY